MKFSIITVCWNSAAVLRDAMASLENQLFDDYEWIVVDGASTDATLEIVQSFRSAPLRWISEPDSGIYNAMNKGVALARGDFVFFLNSDDTLADRDVLSNMAAEIARMPAIDLHYGNVIYKWQDRRTLRTFAHIGALTLPFEDLCHQAVFARRSLFEAVGQFNEKFRLNADYDWLIRVFRSNARARWCDRTIAIFNTGGAHASDAAFLSTERRQVRLQYMSPAKLLVGDLARRVRHRLHRHLAAHPLGQIPLEGH